jgi:hypothetical protein
MPRTKAIPTGVPSSRHKRLEFARTTVTFAGMRFLVDRDIVDDACDAQFVGDLEE